MSKHVLSSMVALLLLMLTPLLSLPAAQAVPGDFRYLWGARQHFTDPAGVAVDGSGNVFVTDTANVRVFDNSGRLTGKWGSYGSGDGQVSYPSGIAVDGTGKVYVADTGNGRIEVFDSSGGFLGKWAHADWTGRPPIAVACDGAGKVYVVEAGSGSDPSDGTIKVFGSGGDFVGQLGNIGTGSDQFRRPGGIAVDGEGNVYVGDIANRRVQVYTPTGEFARTAVDNVDLGHGLAVDESGNVYLNEGTRVWNMKVLVFDSAGTLLKQLNFQDPDNDDVNHYWVPIAVAVDRTGNVYTLDDNNDGLRVFDSAGDLLSQWWTYGTGAGQLSRPFGLAIDADGKVYETDAYDDDARVLDNRVRVFSADGTPIGKWTGTFCQPAGLTIDGSGKIHISDQPHVSCYPSSTGKVFDSSGTLLREWGGDGSHPYYELFGLAIDKKGNFLVVYKSDASVRIFDNSGNQISEIKGLYYTEGGLGTPAGIAVDPDGNIYVSDMWTNTITVYDSDYHYLRTLGEHGTEDGQLSSPAGLAIDAYGHVYVADSGNNRVQVFTTSGQFLTKWGSAGEGDGQFKNPLGIALDPTGTMVYVADTDNNRIQVFEGYGPPKYSISGNVRQFSEAGPGLEGATVSIADQTTSTNSEGAFRIEGLLAGTYTLTISRNGYVTKEVTYVVDGDSSGLVYYLRGYSMSGTVHQGSLAGPPLAGVTVDIAGKSATTGSAGTFAIDDIPGGTHTLFIHKTGHLDNWIYGYVVDGDKSDLSFYLTPTYSMSGTVRLGSLTGPALPGATVTIGDKTAVTATDGTFSIGGIPGGSYALTIAKSGCVTSTTFNYVINGDSSGLLFYLAPTYILSGTVRKGSVSGPGLAGATVAVGSKSATTDVAGAFRIEGLQAGTYPVTISSAGYVSRTVASYPVTGDNSGVVFYLVPAYSVSGTVRQGSANGAPLAGATVAIGARTATTASNGSFSFADVPAGTYNITFSKTGFLTKTVTGYVVNGNKTGFDHYLAPAYTMSGIVRAGSATGAALAGATVSIAGKTATTASTGAFSIANIPAGTCTVIVSKAGYVTKAVTGYPINGNISGALFYLVPTCTLSGTVHHGTPKGPALGGAIVAIAGKTASTDAKGAFTIAGIPEGTYALSITRSGYVTSTVSNYAVKGNKAGQLFSLVPAYTLSGVVRQGSSTGLPLAGATVSVAGRAATTNASGAFTITGIAGGSNVITVSKIGYITRTFTGTGYVINSNKTGLVLYLTPAYTMSGTVRQGSATGPVLAGATVAIAGKTALTSSTGAFAITGIAAGTYTVTIAKSGYVTNTVTGCVISGNKAGQLYCLVPACTVSGTVRQGSATGTVLPGATVAIAGKTATTSSTGAFSVTGIAAGTYTITIAKSGYVTKTVTGYLVNANKSGQSFYLTPAYTMSGTVRQGSATGPLLAGAMVAIAGKTAATSSTGAFSITAVPAGSYTLTVSKSGYRTKTATGYAVNGNKSGLVFYLSK